MRTKLNLNTLCGLLISLIVILFFIIGISYFVLDNLLTTSAKKTLSLAAGKAGEQISCYLQPLSDRATIIANLIAGGSVTPGPTERFAEYLHDFITDEPSIDAAYFVDTNGNFYLIQKSEENKFTNRNIIQIDNVTQSMENIYNDNMQLISSKKIACYIEPLKQLWYKEALLRKHNVWFIFPLTHQGPGNNELGIASVIPIYDKKNNPVGVFGIDTVLSALAPFLTNLEIYDDSIVLIIDDSGRVMSAVSAKLDLAAGDRMRTLSELNIPWVKDSFIIFQKDKKTTFNFSSDGKDFVAVYEKIPNIKSDNQWFIGIITPAENITFPHSILIALLSIALLCVLLIVLLKIKMMEK